jgi:hypothetical protein
MHAMQGEPGYPVTVSSQCSIVTNVAEREV